MEQIPKEVIEMAEDFFVFASNEERKNLKDKYIKEQPLLWSFFDYMIKMIPDKTLFPRFEMMYLVTFRSFQYYGIKLPLIDADFIDKTSKITFELLDGKTEEERTLLAVEKKLKSFIFQHDLLDFIFAKLVQENGVDVQYRDQNNMVRGYIIVISIVFILYQKMGSELPSDIN